jgi:hypothetical protein
MQGVEDDAALGRHRSAGGAADQRAEGGQAGEEDHSDAVLARGREDAAAVDHANARQDRGQSHREVGDDVEDRQHAGALLGRGPLDDRANRPLERAAEARPGDRGAGQVCLDSRAWIRRLFTDQARELGDADPESLGRRLALLYDGALIGASMERDRGVAADARAMAELLLDTRARKTSEALDRPTPAKRRSGKK